MEALQAAIALSETVSVDSDTVRILEAGVDRPGQRRGRKQSKPLRSAFSSDTPSDCQPKAAAKQQQTSILIDPHTGDSPAFNNQAGLEEASAAAACVKVHVTSSKGSSKGSPAQRHGPCGHCKTPYSPQWRKGPRNKPVLCNACGIRYLRNRHLGRAAPQKKRSSVATAKAVSSPADSSAGEGSIDTLTDTTDMRGPSKKRRTKKVELGEELTSLSTYSYDDSGLQAMGSVGSLQQMLLQHQHSSYSDTHPADTDATARRGSDVSFAAPDTRSTGAGADRTFNTAAESTAARFSTSMAMPGNMQPLLAPMHSGTSGSSIYGGGYSMALALQLYQQQQQQLLLNQQHLLLSQASSGGAGLQSAGSVPTSSSSLSGSPVLQNHGSSGPGTPAQASTAQLNSAQATLLYTQSLQMQQLQGYLLQQQHQAQQAQALHAANMLHGPSPLSVMTSAGPSVCGFNPVAARAAGNSLLSMPAASTAFPAAPSLEIAPLVCSGGKAVSTAPQAPTAGPVSVAPAALPVLGSTAAGGVMGSFQSLLAA